MHLRRPTILLVLFAASSPALAWAANYTWLERGWRADNGQTWILNDGLITTFSCGSAYRRTYALRPIEHDRVELLFEMAGRTYAFALEANDSGFCATLDPIWDPEQQTLVQVDPWCFEPLTSSDQISLAQHDTEHTH